ncbi:MarR family winged helix-turn-helix transcriptional regulator [Nocardia cyriacigeorgica]|uniref:MarR family winged helix-turn-helix transcriptional regulator n=1 Tax=Nocardia cyriacigeorgica TaxID=135487 RepID=UPI002455060A|nr:MarR family transcriptional regulator [Nocardia cyriacigeorgica]
MTDTDELALDNQVCFALYAASRAMIRLYRPLLDELGLTYPQYLVMLVLWERGEVSVKDLGAALELDSGTLSPLLKRLEAAGLVHRRRAADDERSVVVEATAEGQALRERARAVPRQVGCATGLDAAELAGFRAQLRAVTAFIDNQQLVLADPEENP